MRRSAEALSRSARPQPLQTPQGLRALCRFSPRRRLPILAGQPARATGRRRRFRGAIPQATRTIARHGRSEGDGRPSATARLASGHAATLAIPGEAPCRPLRRSSGGLDSRRVPGDPRMALPWCSRSWSLAAAGRRKQASGREWRRLVGGVPPAGGSSTHSYRTIFRPPYAFFMQKRGWIPTIAKMCRIFQELVLSPLLPIRRAGKLTQTAAAASSCGRCGVEGGDSECRL